MRLLSRHNLLVTTVLIVVLLAVGLTLVCADGVHPEFSPMSRTCLSMSHSTVIGTAASNDWEPVLFVSLLAVVAGLGLVVAFERNLAVTHAVGESPPPPHDPLMGRLRI